MDKKQRIIDNFVLILIGSFYCISLTGTILASTYVKASFIELFITTAIFLGFLFFCTENLRRIIILFRCVAGIALIIIILFIFDVISLTIAAEYFEDLFRVIIGLNYYTDEYRVIIFAMLSFALSMFTILFLKKSFSFIFLFILGATIFSIQISYEIFKLNWTFVIFWFSIIVLYFRSNFFAWTSKNNISSPNILTLMICVIPISIVIISVSCILSLNKETTITNPIISLSNIMEKITGNEFNGFSMKIIGFSSDTGVLGGPMEPDGSIALYVDTSAKPTYLKGSTKAVYDGASWKTKSPEMNMNLKNDQYYKFLTSHGINYTYDFPISDEVSYGKNLYYKKQNMYITTVGYSYTIFHPTAAYEVNAAIDYIINDEFDIFTKYLLPKNLGYSVSFLQMINGQDNMGDIIRNTERQSDEKNTIDYEKYTQLSDTVTQRTYDLANEITAGETNKYDKVKAIETYLSTTFPYTLETPKTPSGKDFVDYFLFDLKKGYCTYYASAMVIMCRTLGIPARYIEGFTMPYEKNNGIVYTITNQRAHAWPEIYFDGVGWIAFEPTAGFNLDSKTNISDFMDPSMNDEKYRGYINDAGNGKWNRDTSSKAQNSSGTSSEKLKSETAESKNSNSGQEYKESHLTGSDENSFENSSGEMEIVSNGENTGANGGGNGNIVRAIATISLITALGAVSLCLVLYIRKRKDVANKKGNEAVVYYYKELSKIFEKFGDRINNAETPKIYGAKLAAAYPVYTEEILEMTGIFTKAVYSKENSDDVSVEKIKHIYMNFKQNKSKLKKNKKR